jgi:hypothetical protein
MTEIMESCCRSKIFDEVRKKSIAKTPEEKVRQSWLKRMIHDLGFPKELLAVEKDLKELPHLKEMPLPNRRADILCFAKGIHPEYSLFPLLLVECKKEDGSIEEAKRQVIGYNHYVKAYFIAVANEEECHVGFYDNLSRTIAFFPFCLPINN